MQRRAKVLAALNGQRKNKLPEISEISSEVGDSTKLSNENEQQTRPLVSAEEEEDRWNYWDPMAEDYYSVRNTLVFDPIKDPECLMTGKVTQSGIKFGKTEICHFFSKYGSCSDGKFCKFLHISDKAKEKILQLEKNYESNKDRTCMTCSYLSPYEYEPDPVARLLVSVTGAKAPNSFYLVAPYEKLDFAQKNTEDIEFYIEHVQQTSSMKSKLEKCHEQLALLFDHNYRIDNVEDPIYLSQIVACKLKDGSFRRAQVIETEDLFNDKFLYKLLLIDVGVEVELQREMIYDIKAHCLSDPPMAINCRLDVKPAASATVWSQEALDYFTGEVKSQQYKLCKIINYIKEDGIFTVDLFDINSNHDSLTDKFVNSGLAERI